MNHPLSKSILTHRAADEAWSALLVTTFGKDACNARYQDRGKSTPELKRLHDAKIAAAEAEHAEWEKQRRAESAVRQAAWAAEDAEELRRAA